MLIFDEKIHPDQIPVWDQLALKYGRDKVIQFDLETTGLSPKSSFIYIIGINLWSDGYWHILQLFNDDGRSEPEMIRRFMEYLDGKTVLFHFNGDTFDIPFVRGRIDKIRDGLGITIRDRMNEPVSMDLLKEIRPFKYALGLPNVRQKTVEQYLGIYREDQYNGGQLIDVYLSFLSSGSRRNRDLVLLHNRDDMEGMFHLARLHALTGFCNGDFQVGKISMHQKGNVLCLFLPLSCEYAFPKPLITTGSGITLRGEDTEASLEIPIRREPCICKVTREMTEGFYLPCAGYTDVTQFEDPSMKKDTYIAANDQLLGYPQRLRDYATCAVQMLMKQKPISSRKKRG